MSEIDSLGTSYYYSGVQNSTNQAIKNRKAEKTSSTKKSRFSELLKPSEEEEPSFATAGLPPEIRNLSLEDAVLFLKDQVDLAGNDLSTEVTKENIEKFKKAVKQMITFVVSNNYEITKKQKRGISSPMQMFSTFNTTIRPKDPRVQINIINEKLDLLTKETLKLQMNNFKILQQADEIKGLIIDLISY